MANYASPTGFHSDDHSQGGSLLRRKQDQWAREKASPDTWFPFGSPGGGAPNRTYEAFSPQANNSTTEKRPPSRHSNGDSGRWSGSENNPPKEEQEITARLISERVPIPYSVASTSTAQHPTILIAQPSQVMIEGVQQSLPPVAPKATFIPPVASPSSAPSFPIQFVYATNANGQTVPVPIEVLQSPSSIPAGIPYAYPIQLISPAALNRPPSSVADGVHDALPLLASSYTEHWANSLPYWGVARTDDTKGTHTALDGRACVSFPPINGMPTIPIQRPTMLPTVTMQANHHPSLPHNQSGVDDNMRQSMSESLNSFNSSSRRSTDTDSRARAKLTEQAYNEQVTEHRRLEAQRMEDDRRETLIKEREMRRMEELEKEKEHEEERRKIKTEEERSRTESTILVSIERAKREAERLRKAKLYKHVLQGNEALEQGILGEDERENLRVLKEVESLERQRKYDLQRIGGGSQPGSTHRTLSERGVSSNRSLSPRHEAFDDQRPIKGSTNTSYMSGSSYNDTELPICRDRRGRQSMRVKSSPGTTLPRRSGSAERCDKPTQSAPTIQQRPRVPSQCPIPVRPQRRIAPPSSRPKRLDIQSTTACESTIKQHSATSSPITEYSIEPQSPAVVLREIQSMDVQLSVYPSVLSTPLSQEGSSSEHLPNGECSSAPMMLNAFSPQRRHSIDMPAPMAETPKTYDRTGSKCKLRLTNGEDHSLTQNPLFQPVTTRCRRSRGPMGSTENPRESSSCSSGSPPPTSTEDESRSPPPHNSTANECGKQKTSIPRPIPRSSAIKIAVCNSASTESIAKSPFKQSLAGYGTFERHREELLSPEIRRRGEFPNSTRLRNSMANLNAEESDDGRASPVPTLIQRFNSKTSQYRSFNTKKTNERNQKVLEQLAQLRAQLKQKQQQMERTFSTSNSPTTRSRSSTSNSVNSVNSKSGKALAV